MFIELTDHLRCPEDHQEAFLVLLPSRMEGRMVMEGQLGCPVCGKTVDLLDGVVDFGVPRTEPGHPTGSLTAEQAQTLLGLSGPGGYLALVGSVGRLAEGLATLLPEIQLIVVNPGLDPLPQGPSVNVFLAPGLPLKASSMRGIVLGDGLSEPWVRDGIRSVLRGLRIVGEGVPPAEDDNIEVLAVAGEVWVGRRR
jgi:uncharacterized protein YbaR (Trm112 family)